MITEPATLGERLYRALHRLRMLWREHVTPHWRIARAPVLLVLAISVLVLGTIGFQQWSGHQPTTNDMDFSVFDSLYRSITLFAFAGAVTPPVPTPLQIARILAPVLTGYAAIGTIFVLTREQAQLLMIRLFLRRHVIIAGLGFTGSRLALELIQHQPVVAIEADTTNERIRAVKEHGVPVLLGDATDPLVLRQAGLHSCRQLVASCGSDGASIDVATAAALNLDRHRKAALTTLVHLTDLKLWQSLAAESVAFTDHERWRIEYVNVLVLAADLMLEHDQPFVVPGDPAKTPGEAHLLFVGLEGPGEQLVLKAARLWRSIHPDGDAELRMTITGNEADREVASLRARYPQLKHYCRLQARQLDISSAEFQCGAAMFVDGGRGVTHAYVCLLDEGDGMLAALALHTRSEAAHVPVTVIVNDEETGVGDAINKADSRGANIRSFGVLSETACDAMLTGAFELIARSKHEQWLRDELLDNPGSDSPYLKPWVALTEAEKEDNRSFADDVGKKLAMINCILLPDPLPDPNEPKFTFTGDEVEDLAKEEHERWMKTRLEAGWRATKDRDGPRDNKRKLHPDIRPWEELRSEEVRDKDRAAVLELPEILERVGMRIQRRTEVAAAEADGSAAVVAPVPPHHRAIDDSRGQVTAARTRQRL